MLSVALIPSQCVSAFFWSSRNHQMVSTESIPSEAVTAGLGSIAILILLLAACRDGCTSFMTLDNIAPVHMMALSWSTMCVQCQPFGDDFFWGPAWHHSQIPNHLLLQKFHCGGTLSCYFKGLPACYKHQNVHHVSHFLFHALRHSSVPQQERFLWYFGTVLWFSGFRTVNNVCFGIVNLSATT